MSGLSVSSDWKRPKNAEHDSKNIRKVIFILFSCIILTLGIKRCKILCFMKHFYRSLESRRWKPSASVTKYSKSVNAVNVWDHMSCVTSRCFEQFGWCACACFSTFLKYILAVLAASPATDIFWFIAMHLQGLLPRCFQFDERYWFCKLPCMSEMK